MRRAVSSTSSSLTGRFATVRIRSVAAACARGPPLKSACAVLARELAQYPNKEGMGWPTYLVVSDPEGEFTIHGEIRGGMPKGDFRSRLTALLPL